MAHEYEYEGNGGSGFMLGLLAGAVLGAGLGILFAPRSGSELRRQISDAAGEWKNTAGEQYRRATEAAGTMADRGREIYDRARSAVNKGAEEARRYVSESEREATSGATHAGAMWSSERFSPGGNRS